MLCNQPADGTSAASSITSQSHPPRTRYVLSNHPQRLYLYIHRKPSSLARNQNSANTVQYHSLLHLLTRGMKHMVHASIRSRLDDQGCRSCPSPLFPRYSPQNDSPTNEDPISHPGSHVTHPSHPSSTTCMSTHYCSAQQTRVRLRQANPFCSSSTRTPSHNSSHRGPPEMQKLFYSRRVMSHRTSRGHQPPNPALTQQASKPLSMRRPQDHRGQ